VPAPPPSPSAQQETPPPAPPDEQSKPAEPPAAVPPPPPPAAAAETPPAETPAPQASLRPTLPDEAIEEAPKQAEPKPSQEKTEQQKPAETPAKKAELIEDTAKLLELPDPAQLKKQAEKPAEAKPKTPAPQKPAQKKTETAKLDLTPPAVFQAPVGGGGAGLQRPAGITRSGENDDFARGVIRALQTTMPQLRNTFGRVTVRIELDMKGNLVRTTVLRPSNIAGLDQSVVFATKQSSFPFPPHNAVSADLIFFVTYIYR
jgi:TonB family protein